jgi:hypothetical protein
LSSAVTNAPVEWIPEIEQLKPYKRRIKAMKKVEVYSLAKKTRTTIPASELAPTMVLANVKGVGTVFVDALEVKPGVDTKKALPEGFDRIAAATLAVIKSCVHWADEKGWLEGFRKDTHPVRELFGWMKVAFIFHELTHGGTDAPEIQRDVFTVCVQTLNNGEHALETVELTRISTARAKTCMQRMLSVSEAELDQFWADRLGADDFDVLTRLLDRGDQ